MIRTVESGFGSYEIDSPLSDIDWDRYQFNIDLRKSILTKAMMENRKPNRDEKKHIDELDDRNDAIRSSYPEIEQ